MLVDARRFRTCGSRFRRGWGLGLRFQGARFRFHVQGWEEEDEGLGGLLALRVVLVDARRDVHPHHVRVLAHLVQKFGVWGCICLKWYASGCAAPPPERATSWPAVGGDWLRVSGFGFRNSGLEQSCVGFSGFGVAYSGRGTTRAKDAQGTPTKSHISTSILVYEDNVANSRSNFGGLRASDFGCQASGFGTGVGSLRGG